MLILSVRTDKPEAEIGLFDYQKELSYITWEAHRQLATTIHIKVKELLDNKNVRYEQLEGIIVFKGPGSFTGLRIGMTVANAFADSLIIPIIGSSGEDWIQKSISKLLENENHHMVLPEYGAEPHITKPRK